jgi:N-methylhydantoinase B
MTDVNNNLGSGPVSGSDNRFDPVLLAVMANRMESVCREMTNTMLLAARSSVIGMARDFSCAVITSENDILAVAEGFPIHVWGMNIQTKSMADLHPDFKEGDAFLHNDPYLGNTHAADHTIIVPVFVDGEYFFSVGVKAHQADIGNSMPTTYMAPAKDVYHEGALIFPCVQVQEDYRNNDDIIRMCKRRIRVPEQWYGDYLAAVGAARIGERSLKKFVEKYGAQTVRDFVREWLDYSERRCIDAIRKLPKGQLQGQQTHDPIAPWVPEGIPVGLTIDIDPEAGMVTVDLRDNIDCIPAGLNLTESTSTMAAAQGVLTCLGEDLPPNSGSLRRIKVLLRENCVVGIPKFPHSCSVATTNLTDLIVNVTQSAFAELGDGHGYAHGNYCNSAAAGVASGTDWRRDGEPYINQMFMMGGGGGASADCDGMHYLFVPVAAGLLYRDSIEINEQRFPIKVDSMQITTDSMGHGRRRGGPATRVVMGPRKDKMSILHVCNGLESAPKGVRGGGGSKFGGNVKIAKDGTETKYPAVMVCEIEAGEKLRADDQGGGGYGNPLDREVARVLNDVAERYVSREIARDVYGVVVTGAVADDSLTVDVPATDKLRAEMRA